MRTEEFAVHLVKFAEFSHIDEVDIALDHLIYRAAGGFQCIAHMLERLLGFSCDATFHQLKLAINVTMLPPTNTRSPTLTAADTGISSPRTPVSNNSISFRAMLHSRSSVFVNDARSRGFSKSCRPARLRRAYAALTRSAGYRTPLVPIPITVHRN